MKSKTNVHALIILLLLVTMLTTFSCRKDDCPVIDEPVKEENPDSPDGIGINQNTTDMVKFHEA